MKFSIKDFFSKRDQIRIFPRIWLHLLEKSLMENFVVWAVRGLRVRGVLSEALYCCSYYFLVSYFVCLLP